MAYAPQEIKIIPGGINLAAPGDQVAAGDSLDLTGFWPGAIGKLEQSRGFTNLSATQLGSVIDGLCQASGRTYYSASNTGALHQVGRGGAGETAIDTGYDTYPLGMLGYQGYVWIMNRASGKQRKDNGTTVSDWTPAAPGVPALTNPTLASSALTITELDPANPDATSGDFLTIRMWTSSSIAGMEVGALMDIDTGGAATAFDGVWQVTAIYDGNPTSLIEMSAHVPAGTAYSVAGGMTATFGNPSMPMGTHKYWVTWAYTDLGESNPSTSAGVITATTVAVARAGTKVTVSIAALSPPTGATHWNIYTQRSDMPSPYRVNIDPIPVATTSYDDFGDAAHSQDNDFLIDSLGILMEGDHDPAPACRVIANQVYNGRILVANSSAYPNRIWYTPPLQPGFFRGSGNPQAGDWVDVGTDRGDEILFMAVKPGMVTIYRSKSIWRHIGDFGDPNARIEVAVPDLGVVGPRAVVSTSLGDYFRAPEGVYKYNGDWAQKISAKLDPIFRGLTVENFVGEAAAYRSNCALGFRAGRLWVGYTQTGGTSNSASLIYHVETERWFSRQTSLLAFLDTGTGFLGARLVAVVNLESGYDDAGGNTVLAYQSAYEDCGLPDREKTWGDLVVNHNTGGQTLTVRVRTNKGAAATDIFDLDTTISSSAMTKTVIPLVYPAAYSVVALRGQSIRAFNLSVRITGFGPTSSPGVLIDSPLVLHYYAEPRKGKMFDSRPTDHGMREVKTVDQIELDIDASGGATVLLQSDLPGGVIQNQESIAIAATSGRQVQQAVVPTARDGKLFRYRVTDESDFHVYGMRVRVLPIGLYLDGTVGDFWAPTPISIGV
jgi:hypothetical protein